MLRGPQTVGEIRGRTARLYEFASLEEAELVLESLIAASPPLAARLPRQPGAKESRYAHLLSGEVEVETREAEPRAERAVIEVRAENERISNLEGAVADLRRELAELREQFLEFRKQFE